MHYNEKAFWCGVYGCDLEMHIMGERTNGMEMKVERDSYKILLEQDARAYLGQLMTEFETFGNQYSGIEQTFLE